jgi:hypothetical protein
MLEQFGQWFAGLPTTSQAAIIASVVSVGGTLLGVLATNWVQGRRFKRQLAHERDQRKAEREMALRKEVYLKACEAISAALSSLARYSDLDVPTGALSADAAEMYKALYKVHLIGSDTTLKALTAFSSEMGAASVELILRRQPLLEKQAVLRVLSEQIGKVQLEQRRLVDAMEQLKLAGDGDPDRWKYAKRSYEFWMERTNEIKTELSKRQTELAPERIRLVKLCFDRTVQVSVPLVSAMAAVRNELELPFDVAQYEKLIRDEVERQRTILYNVLREVEPPPGSPASPVSSPDSSG